MQSGELEGMLSSLESESAGARQQPMDCSDEEVDKCSRAVGSTEMQRSDSVATFLTCVSGDPDVADARAMDAAPMPTRVTWDFAVEVMTLKRLMSPALKRLMSPAVAVTSSPKYQIMENFLATLVSFLVIGGFARLKMLNHKKFRPM